MVTEIENWFNLRHPLIGPLIEFDFLIESDGRCELKMARLHAAAGSLADVRSAPPAWWTLTAKAKAVVGTALGLRFVYGLGLLHGAVKPDNVLFDVDRRIQIADFIAMRLESGEVEPFSGEKSSPATDVCAFSLLLVEIVVGRPAVPPLGAAGELPFPAGVPEFVSRMIEEGRSPEFQCRLSFVDIIEHLKKNRFAIVARVNSEDVSAFVAWVESAEQSGNWE
jgi:serine/threonine protein kinase